MKLVITTAYVHMVTCYCQMEVSISAFMCPKFLGTYRQMCGIYRTVGTLLVFNIRKSIYYLWNHWICGNIPSFGEWKVLCWRLFKISNRCNYFRYFIDHKKLCGNEIHFGRINAIYSLVAYELYSISMSLWWLLLSRHKLMCNMHAFWNWKKPTKLKLG